MNILVIDDFAGNIASAEQLVPEHTVVTAGSIKEAYEILCGEAVFDAVLTDLFMPIGNFNGQMNGRYIKPGDRTKDVPVGLVFAIKAISKGCRVVICSDADHHTDWICSLLDSISPNEYLNPVLNLERSSRKVVYVEARYAHLKARWDADPNKLVPIQFVPEAGQLIKDWLKVMELSTLFWSEGFV